ncbi:MAG: OmpA family protein [Bacteroidota bacterium]|nr:OmpA family protein [Bacteroidota bacterium]
MFKYQNIHPMKYFYTLSLLFFVSACAVAQKDKPKDSPAAKLSEEAYAQYKEENYDKAKEFIDKALKKDTNYIIGWEYKAEIEMKRGNTKEAIQACLKLTDLEPENYYQYFRLGIAYKNDMQYGEAKKMFEKYLKSPKKLDPRRISMVQIEIANMDVCDQLVKNPVPFKPINMGSSINSKDNEYFPGLTIDGQNFYYTRLVMSGKYPQEDFFWSKAINDSTFQPSIAMPFPVNTFENEGTISVTADGKFIFFTACNRVDNNGIPIGLGSCDIYFSQYNVGKWSTPVNMNAPINSSSWESQPSISSDGLTIYFASNRPGGFGGSDIYKSEFKNGRFQKPENLGPEINTAGEEQSPFIHFDNQTLYFSSDGIPGMGNKDIFMSKLGEDGKFSKAQNIGYPINTGGEELGLIVDRLGQYGFMSSNRPGGYGGLDIYKFAIHEKMKPEPINYVKGIVFDAKTNAKIGAKVELYDLETGKLITSVTSNKISGEFLVTLQANKNYMLNVDQVDYLFYADNFSLKESKTMEPFLIEVPLKKPDKDIEIKLSNVFFDTDKFDIKAESMLELDKLVNLLKKFPFMKIEIGGHTDNSGDKTKNKTLSQNRAKSVKDYLISKGVEPTRLSAIGYGDSKPIASNDDPKGRAINRRTVFKVISVN